MMSGILWILDLKMFMFTFYIKADFVIHPSAMNPLKKSEIGNS